MENFDIKSRVSLFENNILVEVYRPNVAPPWRQIVSWQQYKDITKDTQSQALMTEYFNALPEEKERVRTTVVRDNISNAFTQFEKTEEYNLRNQGWLFNK